MRLKELRLEKNLTQEQLAKALDTSQRNIGRWENGENEPAASMASKIAMYFECSVDYLLGRTDDFGYVTPEEYGAGLRGEKKISITPLEGELLMNFRELGRKHGVAVQRSVITVIENMLDLK